MRAQRYTGKEREREREVRERERAAALYYFKVEILQLKLAGKQKKTKRISTDVYRYTKSFILFKSNDICIRNGVVLVVSAISLLFSRLAIPVHSCSIAASSVRFVPSNNIRNCTYSTCTVDRRKRSHSFGFIKKNE